METQTDVLNVMTDFRQQPNTPEQNGASITRKYKFDQKQI